MLTRRHCRGAAAVLALGLSLCALIIGLATASGAVLASSAERAGAAADAAAHGAEVVLQTGADRDDLSVALQAGAQCAWPDALGSELPFPASLLCPQVVWAAQDLARGNGAELLELHVGPDLRDRAPGAGAGGLIVLVHVAVRRHLPALGRLCAGPLPAASPLCTADAWSAAQAR